MNIVNDVSKCSGLGEISIIYNGGPGIETKGFYGISHLMEHCMCEKMKSIEERLHELGIDWNAYTSNNEVGFFITGIVKNIKSMLPDFLRCIFDYKITKDVFERERNIVLTEYNMYASDQESAMEMNLFRNKYDYFGAGGLKEDIENITYEQFMNFKRKWFSSPSYISFCHPENESDITEEDIKTVYPKLKFNNVKRFNRLFNTGNYSNPMENNSTFDTQRVLYSCLEFSSFSLDKHLNLTFARIFQEMMTSGLNSILMQEVREKLGFVYRIGLNLNHLTSTKFLMTIETSAKADKINIVKKQIVEILTQINKYILEIKYKSAITSMKASYERNEFIRFSHPLDEEVEQVKKNILENSEALMNSFGKFTEFLKSLKLYSATYCLDTDFRQK